MSQTFVETVLRAGKRAFPSLHVAAETLQARAVDLEGVTDERAAEIFLASACTQSAPGCFEALGAYCQEELAGVVSRHAPRGHADDARQWILMRLFSPQVLAGYGGRGSLKGFVRVVATRAAVDFARAHTPDGRDAPSEAPELRASGDVELQLLKARFQGVFQQALRDAMTDLEQRERTLLRQHYLDDVSIDALGRLHDVHRATAARWVSAARERLLRRTREHIASRTALSSPEIDSLVRVLHGELHLSLRSEPPPAP